MERIKSFPLRLRFIRELHAELMHGVQGDKATCNRFGIRGPCHNQCRT